jgi:hypothetical protein
MPPARLAASHRALLVAVLILLGALALHAPMKHPQVQGGDTPAYLLAAHNLTRHGVFGETAAPVATLGREPGYTAFLALLMRVDPALAAFEPGCLASADACPRAMWQGAQRANVLLGLAAAGVIGWLAFRLTAWPWAGVLGFGYLALNVQLFSSRHHLVSDYLALLAVALLLAALAGWARAPSAGRAALAGLALAALVFVKAIFLLLLPLALLAALASLHPAWRRGRSAGLLLAVALLPVLAWMARNEAVAGVFAFTDSRSGIALSTREVFNHMSAGQNLVAFVYWTRGFGDGLARALFAAELWQPFGIDWPGGYYDVGQHRYAPWVEQLAAERGLPLAEAQAEVDRALRAAFLAQPLGYLGSMPALFWRGIWADEFILLGLPALLVASLSALRRRDAALALVLGIGWFNLLAYAALSLNIPRYQMTALPSIALGFAWVAALIARRRGGL